jgi:hypothetical protein
MDAKVAKELKIRILLLLASFASFAVKRVSDS